MRAMVWSGTCHTPTHVDVDPDIGLDGLHAVQQAAADPGGHESPYGNGDLLEHTAHIARSLGYTRDEDIALVLAAATGARSVEIGSRASLVAVEARTVAEVVVTHPARRSVMIDGEMILGGAVPTG